MSDPISTLFGMLSDFTAYDAKSRARTENSYALQLMRQQERGSAVDALSRGATAAGRIRMQGSQLLAKQKMAFRNSGVDAYSGTPADVADGSAIFNEYDALTVENNAAREALGHTRTAQRIELQRKAINNEQEADGAALALSFLGRSVSAASWGLASGPAPDRYNDAGYNQSAIDRAGGF